MSVRLAPTAAKELAELVLYIAKRNPVAARRVHEQLLTTLRRLAAGELPASVDRIRGVRRPVRSWLHAPYRIYFEPDPAGGIVVLRIHHGARRPIRHRPRWRRS
jgi:plasmid stabilization system protein ParE